MKRVLMLSTVASLQDQFNMANIRMLRNLQFAAEKYYCPVQNYKPDAHHNADFAASGYLPY